MRGSPAQQHQLRAEAGAHGEQQAPGARRRAVVGPCVSARTSSTEVDERLPTSRRLRQVTLERALGELERLLHRLQHLRPAGVADPGRRCRRGSGRARRGRRRRRAAGSCATTSRHVGREHDAGSRSPRCPSPSPARSRGRRSSGWRRSRGPGSRRARRPTTTTAAAPSPNSPEAIRLGIDRSSRWRVSEQSSTESSTATSSGKGAHVVGGARDAGRAGDAAEAEDRHPLDARRQPQAVDQAGVDRGRRDAGDGDEEEGVDVVGGEAGALPAPSRTAALAHLLRDADPGVVGLAPRSSRPAYSSIGSARWRPPTRTLRCSRSSRSRLK